MDTQAHERVAVPARSNRRTALLLALVALVFFFGIMLKYVISS